MTPAELFKEYGAIHVKDVVSSDVRNFLTHILLRAKSIGYGKQGDSQVPDSPVVIDHEIIFETLQEKIWPALECIVGFELLPTYSYGRLYQNGNELKRHRDRPACEISVTVQLGRSHNYAWPIYMGNKRYDLAEGDGVIYRGCDIDHWRNPCDGPDGYYSGQVFLHYVDANGPHKNEAYDPKVRSIIPDMYIKHRAHQMEGK